MSWISEHAPVLVLLAAYTALMVHHAIIGHRKTKAMADYYIGGRSMGGVALGISFFATYASTNSFVGFSGQAYTYGVPWLLIGPCAILFSFTAWKWVAPRLRRFTRYLDSVTIPDYIGFRFESQKARLLSAIIVLFASFLYMTAVFKGIGNLLETFLDIPYKPAILIVFVIVVIYTVVGGFISVVKTDVVQGCVMLLAAFFLFQGTVSASGGVQTFFDVAERPETASLFQWDFAMPFTVLLGIMMASTMKFLVEPRQLSRFYALKDQHEVRKGMWVSTLFFILAFAALVPIGIYAHNVLPPGITDSDLVVPSLLATSGVFHPYIAAFLLVAMVAAAMSSLDSVLLVMATTCHRDVVGLFSKQMSDSNAIRMTRIYVALFAFITAIIALNPPGSIVSLTSFSGSLYAACFMPAIVLGIYWSRGDGRTVIASIIAGIGVLLIWNTLPFSDSMHRVFPAMLLSFAVYIGAARMSESSDAVLKLFDQKNA